MEFQEISYLRANDGGSLSNLSAYLPLTYLLIYVFNPLPSSAIPSFVQRVLLPAHYNHTSSSSRLRIG